MFGDDDPFGFSMHRAMQRQMRDMDRLMNSMIEPMFGMGGPRMGMIEGDMYGRPIPSRSRQVAHQFDPFGGFGFGGLFSAMGQLQEHAMNDPNSHVFSHSTVMSFGEDGRHRIVENSIRKSGDAKETRRSLRDGEREEMAIGHTIGDRTHVIEKKRDKDGNVRKQQKFVNLDEANAEDFDREFQSRVKRNTGYSRYGRNALEAGNPMYDSGYGNRHQSNAPVITLPDEDEDEQPQTRHTTERSSYTGPVIREISEEEAESSIPKRRRGPFGMFRANDD